MLGTADSDPPAVPEHAPFVSIGMISIHLTYLTWVVCFTWYYLHHVIGISGMIYTWMIGLAWFCQGDFEIHQPLKALRSQEH
jgi:hypothetical protein